MAENLIYNDINDIIETIKYITLGMTFKSSKVIAITKAIRASSNHLDICPKVIRISNNLYEALSFDNFDEYVDSATSNDILIYYYLFVWGPFLHDWAVFPTTAIIWLLIQC